ncbi:MAG: hypothetical protein CMA66_01025 [Euryarchaeota archaeon]|jgi:hypothetical protein|nr:hypothetical protein [Euryarchaeota archaeon]|tara:strand:+ start:505 stop:1071 length:567 start_codon:yes stop_codon:yes gene_type:complete
MIDQIILKIKNHNWHKTLRDGEQLALDNKKADAVLRDHHIAWELLKEAAKVSRLTYPAPPRTGFPSTSSLPDAPDDVTQWQLMSAYLRGDIESLPSSETKASRPSSEQIDRSELILYLWHHYALIRKGDRSRIKRAVYLKANGVKTQRIGAITGLTTKQILSAQTEAGQDIIDHIFTYSHKTVDLSFF